MIEKHHLYVALLFLMAFTTSRGAGDDPIDRRALVRRHNPVIIHPQADCPLQVGNGEFAFCADVTGLQTFPEFHAPEIPLCTMAHWAWHTSPAPRGKTRKDLKPELWDAYGRAVPYYTHSNGQPELFNWLRENPHKLHLGQVGLKLTKYDGTSATLSTLKEIRQELDMWSGVLTSRFDLEGSIVIVQTCVHPERDALAVRIDTRALGRGLVAVQFAFPYGSPEAAAADWTRPGAHTTWLRRAGERRADFLRRLDGDTYAASLAWSKGAALSETAPHTFVLAADQGVEEMEFVIEFVPRTISVKLPEFDEALELCEKNWKEFWSTGGAIDLSASRDPRWEELERRIVLSQYLTALNAAGSLPPQESGLVCNSWYGKFHLEMHWWHAAQFALWGRWPLLERSLDYYHRIMPKARELAASQGYRGLRWPKMTDPSGDDSPSAVGPLLIWQMPHLMAYAELDWRLHPDAETLEKWKDLVFGTADFMASYAVKDGKTGQFNLGPPLKHVSENIDAKLTRNPAFELGYWRFGLKTAQAWRERLGLTRNAAWDRVLQGLAPLPVAGGVYLTQEGMTDTYEQNNWEHPGQLGVRGMMPGDGADAEIMRATVNRTMQTWQWDRCWGWDFPLAAMAAARSGEPEQAINALLYPSEKKNFYLANGFNKMDRGKGAMPYFPGNGGILYAAAMMAAGWDGAPHHHAPGFPNDGQWVVKWEGLHRAP